MPETLQLTVTGKTVVVCVAVITATAIAGRVPPTAAATQTQVVLLGTGNPPADPDRSGPATAIVVNGTPYLVDFGAGVVRRAKAAVVERGIAALEPANLRVAFVTHLHASLSLRPAVDSERSTPAALLSEMERYPGRVVIGRDLDVW